MIYSYNVKSFDHKQARRRCCLCRLPAEFYESDIKKYFCGIHVYTVKKKDATANN